MPDVADIAHDVGSGVMGQSPARFRARRAPGHPATRFRSWMARRKQFRPHENGWAAISQTAACPARHMPKLLRIFRGALHPGCPGSGPRRRVFQFTIPAMKPAMSSSQPSSEIGSGSARRSTGRGCCTCWGGRGCGATGGGGTRLRANAARMLSRDGSGVPTCWTGGASVSMVDGGSVSGPSSGLAIGCGGSTAGASTRAGGS